MKSQSAVEALAALLAAGEQSASLRVSRTGDVKLASRMSVLLERANSAISRALGKTAVPTNWQQKARQAVLDKLTAEVALLNESVSQQDVQRLEALLSAITNPLTNRQGTDWRTRFSAEIEALRVSGNADTLVASLKKIDQLSQPDNTKLFRHMRPHLKGESSLSEATTKGLKSYLTSELGLSPEIAMDSSKNIRWVMDHFGSTFQEALNIARYADRSVNDEEATIKMQRETAKIKVVDKNIETVMSIAMLRVRHRASLEQAKRVLAEAKAADVSVSDLHHEIGLMLTYDIHLDEAEAIFALAASIREAEATRQLSLAQACEIAWLRLHHDLSPDEAIVASLSSGPLTGDQPIRRKARGTITSQHLREAVKKRLENLLPAGWPDNWEAMPDGTRRLSDTRVFSEHLMVFLKDSFKEGKIDQATGLSTKFLEDAGRSNFRFGTGRDTETIRRNSEKARSKLTEFIEDPMIRQSLSRALFQCGQNSLIAAMSLALGTAERPLFSIISLDQDKDKQNAENHIRTSIQLTDDGKVRVGYLIKAKHFSLHNSTNDEKLNINRRFDSSTPASEKDYTALASVLIEFDMEHLRQGIIEPALARAPELRLTIEPDYEAIVAAKRNELLKSYGH